MKTLSVWQKSMRICFVCGLMLGSMLGFYLALFLFPLMRCGGVE
jgi:hypothetical protein